MTDSVVAAAWVCLSSALDVVATPVVKAVVWVKPSAPAGESSATAFIVLCSVVVASVVSTCVLVVPAVSVVPCSVVVLSVVLSAAVSTIL